MSKETIYFAHPFDMIGYSREGIIVEILESRGYEVVNPFVKEQELNAKYGVGNYYENPTIEFARDIVARDLAAVLECDALFAWIPRGPVTVGTPIELITAYNHKKYTMSLCYKPQPFLWCFSHRFYVGWESFVNDKPHGVNQR